MEFLQQLKVLFQRLGESKSGIDDHIAYSGGVQCCDFRMEIIDDILNEVAVLRHGIHRLGCAPHVHEDVRYPASAHRAEHGLVTFTAGDVIDDRSTYLDTATRDAGAKGIDGDGDMRKCLVNPFDGWQHARGFFSFGYVGGAGSGRISADVEHIGAFMDHFFGVPQLGVRVREFATIVETVGRNVDYAHHAGHGQVEQFALHVQ